MFGLAVIEGEMMETAGAVAEGMSSCSPGDLLDAVAALERIRRMVDACQARLVGEIDARGASEAEAGLTTPVWLAREAGVPRSVAGARVKVARALRSDLGGVDAALAAGRVSWEQARVLADACNPRVADQVAAIQGELMEVAALLPFEAWRREVAGVVSRLDEDGGHDPADDLARNRLMLVPTFDGLTHVGGQLTAEHGAVARHAVDSVADELFHRFVADREAGAGVEIPTRSTLVALAFVELCRRGLATDVDSTVPPRPEVTLVVQAADPERGESLDGVALGAEATRLLCCDADAAVMSVDPAGVPLRLGRARRRAGAGQRRALAVRDGGCIFPGCDAGPRWCDAHHVTEWEHGGRTDLCNLALLCRRHHGITHRSGWAMRANDTGGFTWVTPRGRTLHSQRHHRRPPATAA